MHTDCLKLYKNNSLIHINFWYTPVALISNFRIIPMKLLKPKPIIKDAAATVLERQNGFLIGYTRAT